MDKLSKLFKKLFGQEAARQASKAATDAIWKQENGTDAYSMIGKIVIGCGAGWIAISIIPILCKTPVRECIPLWIAGAAHIVLGALLIILSKKSKKFQKWAEKDFDKSLEKMVELTDKVKVGKVTLPITHGDILAFKFLGIVLLILVVAMVIGTLRGRAVW